MDLYTIYDQLLSELEDEEFDNLPSPKKIFEAAYSYKFLNNPYIKLIDAAIPDAGTSHVIIQIKDKFIKLESYNYWDEGFTSPDHTARYVTPMKKLITVYQ